MIHHIKPTPQFVWPEPRATLQALQYENEVPFASLVEKASSVFGVVSQLDKKGIEWLQDVIVPKESLKCRIVVPVYPACRTRQANLESLYRLNVEFKGRIQFRLYISDFSVASNALCCVDAETKEAFISIGATPNFGINGWSDIQPNIVFKADLLLLDDWKKWFICLWHNTLEIDENLIQIPELYPAKGDARANDMWLSYRGLCDKKQLPVYIKDSVEDDTVEEKPITALTSATEKIEIDLETGTVTLRDKNNEIIPTVCEDMEVPQSNAVVNKLTQIYAAGCLVTIDKASRTQPLDVPMKPQWFGVESFRQIGAITREVRYRVSALDKDVLRTINNKRTAISNILEKFSFPLSDGVRWMPLSAQKLFEAEMTRVDNEGKAILANKLEDGAEAFVDSQRKKITEDANAMYQEFHRESKIPENVINDIIEELKKRLSKANNGKLLPEVSFANISFNPSQNSEWTSAWGQALTLLRAITEYPRRLMTDSFFMRGLKVKQDQLLEAMDVCGDVIIEERFNYGVARRAYAELEMIQAVMNSEAENLLKCECMLCIMAGINRCQRNPCLLLPAKDEFKLTSP